MRSGLRLTTVLAACWAMGALAWLALAGGADAESAGAGGPSQLSGPGILGSLVVPGVQSLDSGEQARDAQEALRATPEAFTAREASQSAYEHLDAEQAKDLAGKIFPRLVEERAGGPPPLPAGESVVDYPSDNVAQLALPDHKHSVIESLEPIALQTSPGHHVPLNLGLREAGGGFQEVLPAVSVHIPKRLSAGIGLAQTDVSLTPTDASGSALSGSEGEVAGASVIYANTLTDADTLVKPTTLGFSAETLLRSPDSPRKLFFHVGMPAGAKLEPATDGSGDVDVIGAGRTIATVLAPSAHDAEGTNVPVSMSAAGDVLKVIVAPFAGLYRLPIAVDPTVQDNDFQNETIEGVVHRTEWHFEHYGAGFGAPEFPEGGSWTESIYSGHNTGEWGALSYTTRGASQITRAFAEGHWNDEKSHIQNDMLLTTATSPYIEAYTPLPEVNESGGESVCAPELHCPTTKVGGAAPENHNTGAYKQEAIGPGEGHGGSNTVTKAYVEISQQQGPELYFNTTSSTIYNERTKENIPNVLFGSGSWLGPHYGAFEVYAKDPGMGINLFRVAASGWEDQENYSAKGLCTGIQCPEYVHGWQLYNNGLQDGEDEIEGYARDSDSLDIVVLRPKVKVDGTPPHAIKLSGLQNGNELPLGEPHLKVEATDGEGTTHSSGMKSIKLSIDGKEVSGTSASCPEGPCTASTEVTLAARNYASGLHSLVVTATDNANNVSQEEFPFRVHGASPVPLGPGTVDPSTGQLTLSSNDVSLGSTSGVSRTYRSANLTAGVEGPLGPQWAINLGAGEGLTVGLNGNATLTASGGTGTTFTRNEKGEFESPKGDGNLKLEAKEGVPGKGITEYLLTDVTNGTKTKFEQPTGTQKTTPTFTDEFGGSGTLNLPTTDAVDAAGDVWVTSKNNGLVEKFSPTGTLMSVYGSQGTAERQFIEPWGIAIDSRNGNVYVSDQGNNRIEELSSSGAFVRVFGWGVGNGKDEFQICTKLCQAGVAGSGNGQFNTVAGLSVDSAGNVWAADFGNNRIQEFNEKGEYQKKIVSQGEGELEGSGNGQFKQPIDIAFSGGNLYVTDENNERVQEFSTAGVYLSKFGSSGSGNEQFNEPKGIATDPTTGNLYVVDSGNKRVQEFTAAGAFVTKFGIAGTGTGDFVAPVGVAVSSSGGIYVADKGSNYVLGWARSLWVPAEVGGPLASSSTTYTYAAVEQEEKTVIEPTEALDPTPAGVSSCTPLARGCRALTFEYASSTKATGENENQWGEYKGHLTKVFFTAWDPSKGAMSPPTAVAQYSYDSKGRLRAEWDPRISSPLKTIYGYDSEGHVTAVSPPGGQPWIFHYGSIAGDTDTGRVLSVARPYASTALKSAEAPVKTVAPALSTTHPAEGVTLSVSEGSWSNSPLVYGYQWQHCYVEYRAEGEVRTCSLILGATNQTYTPTSSDKNTELSVLVTATNKGGSTVAESNFSGKVKVIPYWHKVSAFGLTGEGNGQFKGPWGVTIGEHEEVFVVDSGNGRIERFSSSGVFSKAFGKTGSGTSQFSAPEGIVAGKPGFGEGEVFVADSGNNRLAWGSQNLESDKTKAAVKAPAWLTIGEGVGLPSEGNELKKAVFVSNPTANAIELYAIEEKELTGKKKSFGTAGTGNGQFKGPAGVAMGVGNYLFVVDEGNNRVEEFNEEGQYVAQFGSKGSGNDQFSSPKGIAISGGYIYVVDTGNNRVEEFNEAGEYLSQFAVSSEARGIAVSAKHLYITDSTGNQIESWEPASAPNPLPAPPNPGNNSVSTVEYDVPLSGSTPGLKSLTKEEVEKWGQTAKNDPVEGMAVIAPDEPQGWPAASYRRATVNYWDLRGQTVNTVIPTGGITTSEYNENNQTTRTLSADNRAAAIKEGCVSLAKKECKSAEISEKLDTKTEYAPNNGNVLKVVGPEHTVKLSAGSEVQARNVVHNSYNEKAGEVEAITHETYDLLTWSSDAALLSNGEEKDTRETIDSYSGQENLGWTLRKPTSVTTDPGGLKLTMTTVYDKNTGSVIETRSPKGSGSGPAGSGARVAPVFASQLGSEGTGEGQFRKALGEAFDSAENLWVADEGNDRIQEFSPSGALLKKFGSEGTGNSQFKSPWGIAINRSTGNVYVSDHTNNRVEEFSSAGVFVRTFGFGVTNGKEEFEICTTSCVAGKAGSGNGQFSGPLGVAVDSSGNVWVVDEHNERVEEFSETGTYLSKFGSLGSGNGQMHEPAGIAISGGNLYVSEYFNSRVQEFSPKGTFINEFGTKGIGNGEFEGAENIAADPVSGNLYVDDFGNGRVEEFTPGGSFLASFGSKGSGVGQLKGPEGLAVNAAGAIYVGDTENSRVMEWEPVPSSPVYASQFGSKGTGNGQFVNPHGVEIAKNGNLDVVDTSNNRIEEFSKSGKYETQFGTLGAGNAQLNSPNAMAVDSKGNIWVADTGNNRIEKFNEKREFTAVFGYGVSNGEAKFQICTVSCKAGLAGSGAGQFKEPKGIAIAANGNVYVSDSANNRIEEFNEKEEFIIAFGFGVSNGEAKFETCTVSCSAGIAGSGSGQFNLPREVAVAPNGNVWVVDFNNSRVEGFNEKDQYLLQAGSKGTGNGQFKEPSGIAIDSAGNVWITDSVNNRVQELAPSGAFLGVFGGQGTGNGQYEEPWGIAVTSTGNIYVVDAKNSRVETWSIAERPGNEGARDTQTIYYTAAANTDFPECGTHPEWANLPCEIKPVAQPGISGVSGSPVTTLTYNIWDTPEIVTETFGTIKRIKTQTYDPAGRALTSEVSSSPVTDTALPKVTDKYNGETGALETQSATINGATKTITSKDNSLGQLIEYTDAQGSTTKYVYEEGSDGRLSQITQNEGGEAESKQTYSYDPTAGLLTKLVDSAEPGMVFEAAYDVEGNMTTVSYPNKMYSVITYNQVGAATGIEYVKEVDCASKCPELLFSNTVVPSIHGETLTQSSTLAKESYSYDNAGRLTKTEETPTGKNCTTRSYSYDEESNRTGLSTRESSSGVCVSEGGVLQAHAYDSGNKLIDSGVGYDALGNTTKLPAADAGGYELLSSYFVDGQVAGQEQNNKAINYTYDPAGRTMETASENKETKVKSTVINHYAGPEEALAWTSEGTGKWTRNIPGIDGALDATQKSGAAPELQLHDLQGNIVGVAGYSETETKLLSTYNSTEFGVPTTSSAPKYSWLGAVGVASELPSSGVSSEGGSSYVPEIGRPLQTGPIASPGAFPNGAAGVGIVQSMTPELGSSEMKMIGLEEEATREAAQKKEAEEHAFACPASCTAQPEEPVGGGGGAGGEGGEGIGGGQGDGIRVLPKICVVDGEATLCGETKVGKSSRPGRSEDRAEGWDCALSYDYLWSGGKLSLNGNLTCNMEIKNSTIEGYAIYGSETASKISSPGLPALHGLEWNTSFSIEFKSFRGRRGSTWTQVCWNALTQGGWASGCTGPLTA